jgi:NADPH:quinone reductase-like Zn-dependent oxidoreductase
MKLGRSLGADLVIDYTGEDFTRRGERFDVIFDTVGSRHLYAARRALTRRGTFITVGGTSRGKLLGPATFMFGSLLAGVFIPEKVATLTDMQGTPDDLLLIAIWLDAGTIRPVIDTVYPLEQTAAAMWQVEGGRVAGKVMLRWEN